MANDELTTAFLAQRAMLLRLLTARLGTRADAEDALQDMWLRVAALEDRTIDQPASFLYRMAANLATDRRIAAGRRAVRDTDWVDVQPQPAEFADAERTMIARDRLAAVDRAMTAMPERMRAALILFRVEEQPQRAIAAQLGITVSGVEKLLRRAYRHLHAAADEIGAELPGPHRLGQEGDDRAD